MGKRRKSGIKSRSTGGKNWRHMYAANIGHLSDVEKALLRERDEAGARFRRKLIRIARQQFRDRDPAAMARLDAYMAEREEERLKKSAPGEPGKVRFPGIGYGLSTIRTDLIAGAGGDPVFHVCTSSEEYAKLTRELGDWHSCYPGSSKREPNAFWPVREAGGGKSAKDGRFAYGTATLPKWDTDALQASVDAGELSDQDVVELCRGMDRWGVTEGQRYFSAGADKQLLYCGGDGHLNDGSVHWHLGFLKSARSGFRRADGTLDPRSKAPQRGRPKAGEHWEPGERLGLVAANGKLAFNTLGVGMCAADALMEESFPVPLDFRDVDDSQGEEWALLKRAIRRRVEGVFSYVDDSGKTISVKESGVRAGPNGKGIQVMPGDLMASRHFRKLVRDLAVRVPAFGKRRQAMIDAAKANREAVARDLARVFAGDELARKDVELDTAAGKIRGLEDVLAEARKTAESIRRKTLVEAGDVIVHRLETLKGVLRGDVPSAADRAFFEQRDGVWVPTEAQRELAADLAKFDFAGVSADRAARIREAAKLFGELSGELDQLRQNVWEISEAGDPEAASDVVEEAQREWNERFPGPIPMMPVHVAHEMVAAKEAEAVEAIEELTTQATTQLAEKEAEASIQIERAKVDAFKLVLAPMVEATSQLLSWFRGLRKSGELNIDAHKHFSVDAATTFGYALRADWAQFLEAVERNPRELRGGELKPLLELQRENELGRQLPEVADAVALVRAGRKSELTFVQRGYFADDGELVDTAYSAAATTRVRLIEKRVVPDAILRQRLDALRGIEVWTKMPPVERAAIWHGTEKPAPLREVELPDNVVKFPNQKGAL